MNAEGLKMVKGMPELRTNSSAWAFALAVLLALCLLASRQFSFAGAVAAGVQVRRASRCLLGGVVGSSDKLPPSAGTLTAVQARIELMLDLLAERSH